MMPSDEDISAAEELVCILDMFHSATEIVSGESYPTLGIVQPLLHKLLTQTLAASNDNQPLTKKIKEAIREDLLSHYQDNDIKSKLSLAMYLDPRFKALLFLDESARKDVKDSVKLELIKLVEQQKPSTEDTHSIEAPPTKKTKLTTFLDGMIGPTADPALDSEEIALHEIRKYDREDVEKLDMKEPLIWWKAREQQYKYMTSICPNW